MIHLDNRTYSVCLRERGAADEDAARVTLALSLEEAPTWLPTEGRRTVLATAHDKPLPVAERDGVVLPALGWAVLGA